MPTVPKPKHMVGWTDEILGLDAMSEYLLMLIFGWDCIYQEASGRTSRIKVFLGGRDRKDMYDGMT